MHRSALLPALAPGSFRASEWTDVYWSSRPHFPSPLRLSPMTRNTACVGTKESLLVWWMELCALPGKLINVFLLVSFFFSLSPFFFFLLWGGRTRLWHSTASRSLLWPLWDTEVPVPGSGTVAVHSLLPSHSPHPQGLETNSGFMFELFFSY